MDQFLFKCIRFEKKFIMIETLSRHEKTFIFINVILFI